MNTKNINTLINPISISEDIVKEFKFKIKKNNYLIYAGLVSEEKG